MDMDTKWVKPVAQMTTPEWLEATAVSVKLLQHFVGHGREACQEADYPCPTTIIMLSRYDGGLAHGERMFLDATEGIDRAGMLRMLKCAVHVLEMEELRDALQAAGAVKEDVH